MVSDEVDERWRESIEGVTRGLREWRATHPGATFREIEAALDERLDRARARMLEAAAQASPAACWVGRPAAERPRCGACGGALEARGQHTREVTVQGDQTVRLRRGYGVCPGCGAGVFPPG
jgi:YgiT-type zinc finger domain-containing protein